MTAVGIQCSRITESVCGCESASMRKLSGRKYIGAAGFLSCGLQRLLQVGSYLSRCRRPSRGGQQGGSKRMWQVRQRWPGGHSVLAAAAGAGGGGGPRPHLRPPALIGRGRPSPARGLARVLAARVPAAPHARPRVVRRHRDPRWRPT